MSILPHNLSIFRALLSIKTVQLKTTIQTNPTQCTPRPTTSLAPSSPTVTPPSAATHASPPPLCSPSPSKSSTFIHIASPSMCLCIIPISIHSSPNLGFFICDRENYLGTLVNEFINYLIFLCGRSYS
ncbi:hypothetical protein PRUPE_4G064300 [Prunus persica]|uniref:Uncharacterized protein n=1 Tax=Prunus persica TaxID=3760 RepID=A0A251PGM4_PRUPE|nr:hypothetical protein PRUPE_4G064300 [Prunus persica]